MRLHHAAICTSDVEASLRFWRDGIGLEIVMDHAFDGDWPTLFGAPTSHLRSVFLGEPGGDGAAGDDAGLVELVDFGPVDPPPGDHATTPALGFFLLSFNVDLTATLARLAALDLGGPPTAITVHGVRMAVVRSPESVRVELIDLAAVPIADLSS